MKLCAEPVKLNASELENTDEVLIRLTGGSELIKLSVLRSNYTYSVQLVISGQQLVAYFAGENLVYAISILNKLIEILESWDESHDNLAPELVRILPKPDSRSNLLQSLEAAKIIRRQL